MANRVLFLVIIFTSVYAYRADCQVSYGGTPASFSLLKSAALPVPVIEMTPVSNFDLQFSEVQSKNQFKKQKFAKAFDVDISPANAGIWTKADGMKKR